MQVHASEREIATETLLVINLSCREQTAEAPSVSPYAPSRFPHSLLVSEPRPLLNPTALVSPESFLKTVCVHAKSLQSYPTLCDPVDCSLPGSSVHGILQARRLEWVAMHSSRGSSPHRDQTHVSCDSWIAGGFFTA